MSDGDDFMQDSDQEEYDFEYEDDDEQEGGDVDIENKYYNAKQIKGNSPEEAIEEFLGVPALESEKGDWGFKGLKQAIKLEFQLGRYEKAVEHYRELLTYVKSAVTRNYSEKSINNMLDFIEKGSEDPQAQKCMEEFYSQTLESFQSTNNERLWLKTNIKLSKLFFDRKDYPTVTRKLRELHKACEKEDGSIDASKATYALEIYALEIQMCAETKNNKQLKRLYVKSLSIKSAVPHPKIQGIIRECGGKMHMSEEDWEGAQSDFFEAFRNYDEAGDLQRIQVLKYLVLTTMLMKSNINPFESQETKPYKNDPRIAAMTDLVDAYQRDDIHKYESVLQGHKDILEDPFIAENIDEVTRNMRTKAVLKLIAPYTRFNLAFIGKQLKISIGEVQDILSFLIVDKKVAGKINQQDGTVDIENTSDAERLNAMQQWSSSISSMCKAIFADSEGYKPQATPLNLRSSYGRLQDNNIGTFTFQDSGYSVSAGSPIVFETPAFSQQGTSTFTPINPATNHPTFYAKMDESDTYQGAGGGDKSFPDDISRAEHEAMKYEPEMTGPLVGEKKSCLAITEEYARADPVYVAKTEALPQTYSHYRPIRGDGNCGWRAIACGYFEALLQGDSVYIETELARLTSLNVLFERAGFESWVYEDMIDATFDLLKLLVRAKEEGMPGEPIIVANLNDPDVSNAIVYHFRLLTSATLRLYPAEYEPFIPDGLGLDGYCKTWLEPSFCEIEHLGISLLVDVLLKPISIAVEIVYLDRSEGSQVNTHRFGADISTNAPTIHLLYRPGHYDILYKHTVDHSLRTKQILEEASRHSNIQVHRASSFAHQHESTASNPMAMGGFSGADMSILSHIPGFSMAAMGGSHHGFPSVYNTITTPLSTPSFTATSPTSPHPISYTNPTTTTLPLHPAPPSVPRPNLGGVGVGLGAIMGSPGVDSKFRMSVYELEAQWQDSAPTFQTSTFKNSHYNTAHYNNPNFHPEQWSPEADEGGGGGGKTTGSGRHHSS